MFRKICRVVLGFRSQVDFILSEIELETEKLEFGQVLFSPSKKKKKTLTYSVQY